MCQPGGAEASGLSLTYLHLISLQLLAMEELMANGVDRLLINSFSAGAVLFLISHNRATFNLLASQSVFKSKIFPLCNFLNDAFHTQCFKASDLAIKGKSSLSLLTKTFC